MLRCRISSSKPLEWSIQMLVLSRKANESLIISDNIEVVILEIRHGVVRIGIKAPRQISVVRSELCEAKSTLDSPQVNSNPVNVASGPPQTPLTDALSDLLLHSFCERRRSGRTPDILPTTSRTETGAIAGTCFG